ncbi:MAG TPA: tRNA lysidine(34) synthetase TilS [Planctomycetota bacterium]|nr:tRNA lysidine(34) synthetase TilS [Planctomycetota bacterium]
MRRRPASTALHPFEAAVRDCLRSRRLAADGDRVVVALSGGADSTALLLALHALARGPGPRLRLVAAHLDHGLRPGSAADARAAAALARRLRVPFRGGRLRGLRGRARGSLEAAARRERYAFLATVAARVRAAAVAVAHHADDRAETVLHRLLQGATLRGLSGMPVRRPLPGAPGCRVVRPLFDLDRAAVLGYLRDRGAAHREDPTNGDGSNARARLRARVLPAIGRAYPGFRGALLRVADLAREAGAAIDASARARGGAVRRAAGSARLPRTAFEGAGREGIRRLLAALLDAIGEGAPGAAAVDRTVEALARGDGRERRVPVRGGVEARVGPGGVRVGRVSSSSRSGPPPGASSTPASPARSPRASRT